MAHRMAVSAERAYRFETGNEKFFVEAGNWDASRAGLLAGERLLLQLQAMEASFLERDSRRARDHAAGVFVACRSIRTR